VQVQGSECRVQVQDSGIRNQGAGSGLKVRVWENAFGVIDSRIVLHYPDHLHRDFNQRDYTFTLILLITIVLCGELP